jgi:alkaline phosphatase D
VNRFKKLASQSWLLTAGLTVLLMTSSLNAVALASSSALTSPKLTHILFGSCSHQDKPMPIFDAILNEPADGFIFLGDNIYGDTEDMEELSAKYQKLGNNPGFKALRSKVPVYAIWDDHDFGENDAGKSYPFKQQSKAIMLDFWGVPKDSPRRKRQDGIYGSYVIQNDENHKSASNDAIRVILPDLRYMRDDLESVGALGYYTNRKFKDMGPYKPSKGSMLSQQQWQWLELELQQPERIKIIGSSLQLIADFTGWESWANFDDRQRLFDLIKKHKVNGVFIISGDTHWGEISKFDEGMDYPLWDVTSSGLTEEWKQVSPNKHRTSGSTAKVNYGFFTVNWEDADPSIHFGLKDIKGDVVMEQKITLSTLSPY